MKKTLLCICLALFVVGIAGCEPGVPSLKIANNSSVYLGEISWSVYEFGGMYPGDYLTLEVVPGTDFVYFTLYGTWFRTTQSFTVGSRLKTVIITDNTYVTPLTLAASKCPMESPIQLKDLPEAVH